MNEHTDLTHILVLDIETVPGHPALDGLEDQWPELWRQFRGQYDEDEDPEKYFYENAGFYPEFGKIVCISVGAFINDRATGSLALRVKSFADHDEYDLLKGFAELLNHHYNNLDRHRLCGHNLMGFDFPYICRRSLIHGIPLPRLLDIGNLKPWEVPIVDTMDMWRFGKPRSRVSLKLLAALLGIPTPKDDIDGSQVADAYWKDHDLARISRYCQKDVVATAQLLLKLKGIPMLKDSEISIKDDEG